MPCQHCTDPDGAPCYPYYGLAPHLHGTGPGFAVGTHFVPRDLWPNNFREDPDRPNHGTYLWCPKCKEPKTAAADTIRRD